MSLCSSSSNTCVLCPYVLNPSNMRPPCVPLTASPTIALCSSSSCANIVFQKVVPVVVTSSSGLVLSYKISHFTHSNTDRRFKFRAGYAFLKQDSCGRNEWKTRKGENTIKLHRFGLREHNYWITNKITINV